MYRQTVADSQWEVYHNRSATDQMVLACQMLKEDRNIRGQNTDCFTNYNGIYIQGGTGGMCQTSGGCSLC